MRAKQKIQPATGTTPMIRPTRVEVDLAALRHNAGVLAEYAKNAVLVAVVKADGYGHGAIATARAALEGGAKWLAVSLPEEGEALRQAGISAPILVLGALLPGAATFLAWDDLRLTVFDPNTVDTLEALAKTRNCQFKVHVKLDTGMNRIGVKSFDELDRLLEALQKAPHLCWEGTFTHFARADEADMTTTRMQLTRFEQMLEYIKTRQMQPGLVHAANSAGLLNSGYADRPDARMDMVRAGVSLYGYAPSEEVECEGLRRALCWKTAVVHVKEIVAGEAVSYGGRYVADGQRMIATLPVGYADGYQRMIGDRGWVLIHGQRAPVRGRVCMDQCMVDVTDIFENGESVNVGDMVTLLGRDGNEEIDAVLMGEWCGTIHYEILTTIGARVERVYVNGEW